MTLLGINYRYVTMYLQILTLNYPSTLFALFMPGILVNNADRHALNLNQYDIANMKKYICYALLDVLNLDENVFTTYVCIYV